VEKAAELNKQLLTQRVGAVQAQLKTADDALDNAIESEGKTDWVREKEVR
jgi:predicted negative regulator of RcsB-dependent stress response